MVEVSSWKGVKVEAGSRTWLIVTAKAWQLALPILSGRDEYDIPRIAQASSEYMNSWREWGQH